MKYTLKKHQIELQQFLTNSPGLGVLGWHGMGLGKTLTSLDFWRMFKAWFRSQGVPNAKFLVICPKSAVLTWKEQCQMWTPDIWNSMVILPISRLNHAKRIIAHHDIRFVVIDESHYLKNPEADRTKEMAKVLEALASCPGGFQFGKILKLTGTPFLNNAGEFYPTWAMLTTNNLHEAARRLRDQGRFYQWKQTFTNCETLSFAKRGEDGYMKQITVEKTEGVKNSEGLVSLLQNVIHYRRVTDCLDMPKLNKIPVMLNIPDDNLLKDADIEKPNEYMAILEKISRAKIPHALEWIKEFKQNSNEQLVIFSMYKEPIAMLKEKLGKDLVVISGEESPSERAKNVKRFQEGKVRYIALTFGAGAESLNLQNACYTLYLNFPWTAGKLDQAIARTWRQGQQRVTFHYFLMSGESDKHIYEKVESKRANSELIENTLLDLQNVNSFDQLI